MRIRIALRDGWWRELWHWRKFAEWTDEGNIRSKYERGTDNFFWDGFLRVFVVLRLLS
jgi:hypothetical protein